MEITFAVNKVWPVVVSLMLTALAGMAQAAGAATWLANESGVVRLTMSDSSTYALVLPDNVAGVYLDPSKHSVGGQHYVSVFQSVPSNAGNPSGYCGAGSEMRLKVYRVEGSDLVMRKDVLVSSCLHSMVLSSQNTGDEDQDINFSSVQWDAGGFSITWEGRLAPAAYPLDGKGHP